MRLPSKISLVTGFALLAATLGAPLNAQEHGHPGPAPAPAVHAEPHPGPKGWNNRPPTVDRTVYQHNYQAARSFHVGVYRRPAGWTAHHWAYGEVLPRPHWATPYILADYWLFALEVPPPSYAWVRDNTDAILVNISTGEILQVEYGVFA